MEYNTKYDRREKKRTSKKNKWVKHQYGEWWKSHGSNLTKWLKKVLVKKKKKS